MFSIEIHFSMNLTYYSNMYLKTGKCKDNRLYFIHIPRYYISHQVRYGWLAAADIIVLNDNIQATNAQCPLFS